MVCSKGVALSICPLNHPLSAATPSNVVPRARSNEVVPAFSRLDWSVVNNNLEMVPRDEIFNVGLKAKCFDLGCYLNHLNSTWRENNSGFIVTVT